MTAEQTAAHINYFIWNTVDCLLLINYMNRLYGKPKNLPALFAAALLLSLATTAAMRPDENYLNLVAITASCLFLLPFYKRSLQTKILFGVISLTIAGFCTIISFFIFILLSDFSFPPLLIFLTHFFFSGCLEIAPRLNKNESSPLPYRVWALLLTIPAASIVVLICLMITFNESGLPGKSAAALELPASILLLGINFMVFYLFNRFSVMARTATENALLTRQAKYNERHYRQIENTNNQIHGIRHDINNNLRTLLFLSENNKQDELRGHLNSLLGSIVSAEETVATQNPAVDSVLNIKISEMKENGIEVETEIAIPPGLKISFAQAVIILGNIFDNAAEACLQLPRDERKVKFKMRYASRILFISLTNPFTGLEKQRGDNLPHGIGLKNVKKTLAEMNGTMEIKKENGEFAVKIVIYNLR